MATLGQLAGLCTVQELWQCAGACMMCCSQTTNIHGIVGAKTDKVETKRGVEEVMGRIRSNKGSHKPQTPGRPVRDRHHRLHRNTHLGSKGPAHYCIHI